MISNETSTITSEDRWYIAGNSIRYRFIDCILKNSNETPRISIGYRSNQLDIISLTVYHRFSAGHRVFLTETEGTSVVFLQDIVHRIRAISHGMTIDI